MTFGEQPQIAVQVWACCPSGTVYQNFPFSNYINITVTFSYVILTFLNRLSWKREIQSTSCWSDPAPPYQPIAQRRQMAGGTHILKLWVYGCGFRKPTRVQFEIAFYLCTCLCVCRYRNIAVQLPDPNWKAKDKRKERGEGNRWNGIELNIPLTVHWFFRGTEVKFRGANQLFKVAPFLFDLEKTTSRWLLLIWKNKVKCLEALLLTLMDSWIFNDHFSNGEFTWVIPCICAYVGLCYS